MTTTTAGGADFAAWERRQELQVPAPGLIKLSLPADTLDAAKPDLEDLRLIDSSGTEVPYQLERPTPAGKASREAKSFQAALEASATVLTLETGLPQAIDGVTLSTPASGFIKAAQIEGSADRLDWRVLTKGLPIFRQLSGASQLRLAVPEGVWPFLKVTIDDRQPPPIPFTGALIHAALPEPVPSQPIKLEIVERTESADRTRLTLRLEAAHLTLASIAIETSEPLFTRPASLATRQIVDNMVKEESLARGTIYRVAVTGQPVASNPALAVEAQAPSREVILLIDNGGSPPLSVAYVTATRRPVYLVFLAKQSGRYLLLTGNRLAQAARYDLAGLSDNLKAVAVSTLTLSPIAQNPSYRAPEVRADLQDRGAALDLSRWKYRKRVQITDGGVQQVELDLDVLSHAQSSLRDLRLVREGRQHPYIVERTSLLRTLLPEVASANDPKRPRLSRWSLRLSHSPLPVERLTCAARTPIFQRDVVLYEEVPDDRGSRYSRQLGQARWVQTPDQKEKQLTLPLTSPPSSDRLFVETDNGDNPPLELESFQFSCPAPRLLFKATGETSPYLYYGNREADFPRYDLTLVADQLLSADKSTAKLGAEELLQRVSWSDQPPSRGAKDTLFWGALIAVVVALLVVISRLLPKTPSEPPGEPK